MSAAYVEFLVGPEKQSFIVPKTAVDKRSYFSNRHHAYLRTNGSEGWSIEIPSLASMNPEHFKRELISISRQKTDVLTVLAAY